MVSFLEFGALEEPVIRLRGAAYTTRIMHRGATFWAFMQHMAITKGIPPPFNHALEIPEWFLAFRAQARKIRAGHRSDVPEVISPDAAEVSYNTLEAGF